MRFSPLMGCCSILVAFTGWLAAQSNRPGASRFSLEIAGRQAGSAEYNFTQANQGFHLASRYSFTNNGNAVKCSREADLDAQYGLLKDFLTVNAGDESETVAVTVDIATNQFSYQLKSSTQNIDTKKDLHPGTIILNNFDPSGIQHLILLAETHPAAGGNYWALLAQGKGVYLPVKLGAADAAVGTLDGAKLELKHRHLEISGVDSELWADAQNRLMEFVIPAQQLSYRRIGFERPQTLAGEERKVSFSRDGVTLAAILTLPKKSSGPVPAVVLVHDSGPHDADETIGPNKPFRDIAWGLATAGIASLRYDKPEHSALPDLDREVARDAVAALQYVAGLPEIDRKKIFLLGHGQGGTLAPMIAADFLDHNLGSLRGIIFMAAPAQDSATELTKLGLPALVLRGFKDIQTSEMDFNRLEEANLARGSVGEQFDGLNHLFIPVGSSSVGEEGQQAGHVSPDVIYTIARWVLGLP